MSASSFSPSATKRRLRLVAILHGADEAGLSPLPLADLHNIAYLADALAPVWDLRILDVHLLKRKAGAFSPVLQEDLDRLVGLGVVRPSRITHDMDADGSWRLSGEYTLIYPQGSRILTAAASFEPSAEHVEFIVELVHAMSALGIEGMSHASSKDAAYGSSAIDIGSVIDLGGERQLNLTARVAFRFGPLLGEAEALTRPEMIHLYVRELYKRLGHAA